MIFLLIYFRFGSHIVEDFEVPWYLFILLPLTLPKRERNILVIINYFVQVNFCAGLYTLQGSNLRYPFSVLSRTEKGHGIFF